MLWPMPPSGTGNEGIHRSDESAPKTQSTSLGNWQVRSVSGQLALALLYTDQQSSPFYS